MTDSFHTLPGQSTAPRSLCVCAQWPSHVWLCNPMDCSPPGSSVHGILQARILEWVATSYSRESSQPREWTCISCLAGRFFTVEPPRKPHLEAHYSPKQPADHSVHLRTPMLAVALLKFPCEWLPGTMTCQHLTKPHNGYLISHQSCVMPISFFARGLCIGKWHHYSARGSFRPWRLPLTPLPPFSHAPDSSSDPAAFTSNSVSIIFKPLFS